MKRARTLSNASTVTVASKRSSRPARSAVRVPRPFTFKGLNLRRTGLPDQLRVKHKYVETYPLTSTSGAMGQFVFSANGMYDPNITGAGVQPLYFDQLAALYDHYTVVSSKCTITCMQSSSAIPTICALVKDDDTGNVYASINGSISNDTTSWGYSTYNNPPLKLVKFYNSGRTYGVRDLAGDPTMSGTSAANPTEQTYFRFIIQSSDFTTTSSVNFTVEIEYDAIWRERKEVAES